MTTFPKSRGCPHRVSSSLSSAGCPRQCVKRLMRAAARTEPVGEALEVDLIDLVEDRHHSLLDDPVLQSRDAQRALPPIGLRYIDSP